MKALIDQWTDSKSLKRLLSSIFIKGARSKQTSDSTAKPLPTINAGFVPGQTRITTTSTLANQNSSRGETSSISTFGSVLLRRIRESRISPNADSPLRRQLLSPSSVVLTDATSLSSLQQQNPRKCRTCSYEPPVSIIDQGEPPRRAPMTARYPEIFTYLGRNGVPNSALALTNDVVRNLNEIFYLEGQLNDHTRIISRLDHEYECVEMTLKELNQLLLSSGTTVQSERDAKLEEMKYLFNVSSRIQEQKLELLEAAESEYEELSEQRIILFNMLRDVFKNRNLLDIEGKNSRQNQFYRMPTTQLAPLHKTPRISTCSEEARERIERDQREAVHHMKDMGYRLEATPRRLDNWKQYYEDEYAEYARAVSNGTMEPARSFFDLTLLQEHQGAIEGVIEAENDYEKARARVRVLNVVLSDIYQSSGFANCPDDGYRISMEEAMVGDVDREWILDWMERNDESVDFETDEDEWEAKSIGLDDSVSVVAKGRERKRIDRWREMCMAIGNDFPELPKVVHHKPTSTPSQSASILQINDPGSGSETRCSSIHHSCISNSAHKL
ncbi:uncharacterized protein EAF01_011240 [Botrytis porri]|uniref:Uncharacterized protein n=1 Tax=Botrytis porri TaxID=87229 RepID=A0A4Z1KJ04_9HELO|nr:uncharacterized protein EAF01_011240 [Botrytis porri]KAF7886562.1 hypothetical protein EAF01_011240 [Botrytis porri]TGO81163.1 hypothetical protein BPOR_1307g00020 [Botrytis porri]